ncbi:MAG: NAD(P)/FAD-dependent oxidoreductase [Bacilli bacterium]|nr:NAD(P)/FAD-dependent oxidoreductase [Bacilli bacterium]
MKKKIVIAGAGPAGLTFAYELLKKSKKYEVIILEESNDIGGISKTVKYKGNRIDIGGHRFFTKSDEVNKIWREILPIQGKPSKDDLKLKRKINIDKNGPDPEKTNNVLLKRNRISRILFDHKFYDYPISLKLDTIKNMGFIRTIACGFSYIKSSIFKRKETNLENFYINRFGKKLYSLFFEDYTTKVWGRSPKEIDASWGAQRVKGISIRKVLGNALSKIFNLRKRDVETSLIEEFTYPKLGPGYLYEEMANKITSMGGKVIKNQKVIKVINKNNSVSSVITLDKDNNEIKYNCNYFISSMPLKDLIEAMDAPKKITSIASNLPYRDFITFGILVKKLKIKNKTNIKTINNIIPDTWIYVQDRSVKMGRIQVFNNWSPYMVKDYKKSVWVGLEYFCNEDSEFWNMSKKKSIEFAINELEQIGFIDKKDVIDATRIKVKKAYPAYFDSYSEIDKIINYINKFDNLYCIGRNGQHRYNNMDHSMLTAIKAVDSILNNSDKKEIWNVNIEQDYHEENNKSED